MGGDAHDGGQQDQKEDPLLQDGADLKVVLLTVSASDQNLGPDAESESDHEDRHVVDTGDGRCPQFDLTDPSQKGRIGQPDHVFHHQTDQDRVGHTPYLSACRRHGDFRMNVQKYVVFPDVVRFCSAGRYLKGRFGRLEEKK